ncbi:Armadillo repeat-containing protein 10, partial [Frankliniella fusca]
DLTVKMSAASGDKTVNKVALCSAIFAGFAYVGYSVVRTAFCRKLGRRGECEGYEGEHRLYFRRLSQTTQTDVLLGNLDMDAESGRIILRPLTVQERIRDLNCRARMFTDTMLAIQAGAPSPGQSPKTGPRSLQCSPWSSPRILSPVDVRTFLASRSTENLSGLGTGESGALRLSGGDMVLVAGSPMHRRWMRRSVRQGTPVSSKSRSPETPRHRDDEMRREAERLLRDDEEELRMRLDTVQHRDRVITSHEAKSLIALLHSSDDALLERTLTTIANCSTFTANQDMIREAGGLFRLQNLLQHPKQNIQLAAIKALANLALNQENQKELKDAIPMLLSYILRSDLANSVANGDAADGGKSQNRNSFGGMSEALLLAALVALTNVAVLTDWHDEFYVALHSLYRLVDNGNAAVKLQSLRLLINLSCNEDMVPSLLAAQAPRKLIYLLDPHTQEDVLLRVVTLLANLTTAAKQQQLDPTVDLPAEDKAASPDTMYAAIFGVNVHEKIVSKSSVLSSQHPNEDVRFQATKLYEAVRS